MIGSYTKAYSCYKDADASEYGEVNGGNFMLGKKEFIQAMADYGNISQKNARKSLYLFIDTLAEVLDSGETVKIIGLGKFKVKETKERIGRNPATSEPIVLPS